MIKKFKTITNLAVFKDFNWDNAVIDKEGHVIDFKTINIIYGRNYSGKTTLSRIVRALETGSISDKYSNPEFEIEFEDGSIINQDNYENSDYDIRVFNEDFIRDNLSFLLDTNNDGEIKPFAVLGEDNAKLQSEIDSLKALLGSNEEGNESGLYKDLILKTEAFKKAEKESNDANQDLNNKLSAKATGDRDIAIKYKPEIYGDQNYNVSKLKNDIQTINQGYTPISDIKKEELLILLRESIKGSISSISDIFIDIHKITEKVRELVEQKVGDSQKIEELVRDAELNRWVKDGRQYHKEKGLEKCSFCGHTVDAERWALLDKHFDEESEKLEIDIDELLNQLTAHEKRISAGLGINKTAFYSKFQAKLDSIENEYNNAIKGKALQAITSLKSQLEYRKNHLFIPRTYEEIYDFSADLSKLYQEYHQVEIESNDYSKQLLSEQSEAKKQLRLDEVYSFIKEINYNAELNKINLLKTACESKEQDKKSIETEIHEKEGIIKNKLALMNDEEKGAKKVDEYLSEYFGHNYLSLRAKEEHDEIGKKYRFEILRDGEIAYNLSEGECSLIAFCYFMAKLDDVATHDKKPIIWIDDPISSLDSNHVFFIYSLIATKIANTNTFNQLFVSTHNLNFLGYLKRMNGKYLKSDSNKQKQYFCVNRCFDISSICIMPNYLKEHITEFNYLFREIYVCSKLEVVDNTNFHSFYDFGNNARKFLEIFLFYKYPDETEERIKMEKFFGVGNVPVIFSERINNEYSHLKENVSRGFSTIDVPEMKTVAKLIINAIKRNDIDQYKALINSIGVSEDENL